MGAMISQGMRKEKRVKDGSQVSDLSTWVDGGTIFWGRKLRIETELERQERTQAWFNPWSNKVRTRHLGREGRWQLDIGNKSSGAGKKKENKSSYERFGLEKENWKCNKINKKTVGKGADESFPRGRPTLLDQFRKG